MCLSLIENIQREDLNPLDQARALSRLMAEFDMTHETVADAVGRSRSAVTNLIRLLELNDKVKTMLEAGDLDMGHARALLALPNGQQLEVGKRVIKQDLSVRATESLVRKMQSVAAGKGKKPPPRTDPDIHRLENELSERLGSEVRIKHSKRGKGTLQIAYNSLEQLEGILSRIK